MPPRQPSVLRPTISSASLIAAACFAAAGLALTVSIAYAFSGASGLLVLPGSFFAGAYGYLAFGVPAYFFAAAFIAADSRFRPGRIFALAASVLPFLTATAASFAARGGFPEGAFPLVDGLGPGGILAIGTVAVTLEIWAVAALAIALFPPPSASARPSPSREKASPPPRLRFLPPPSARSPEPSAPRGAASVAEAAAPLKAAATAAAVDRLASLSLPDVPPLASLAAEREIASRGARADGAAETAALDDEGSFLTAGGPLSAPVPAGRAARPAASEEDSVDLSALLSGGSSGREVEISPAAFLAEATASAEELDRPSAAPAAAHPAAGAKAEPGAPLGVPGKDGPCPDDEDDEDDLERALHEAEAEAEAKSRAAEQAAAARSAEAPAAAVPPRKRASQPYGVPVDGILTSYPDGQYWIIDQATRDAAVILKETLEEFNIAAEVTGIRKGPVITMFEILPAPGVKLSKIVNLQDNIALRLAASSVRIVAPIPGKHAVGIEVPNRKRAIVSFREMIEGELEKAERKDAKRAEIPVILGKDITGEAQTLDLVQTPHLLIAGSTGSGKSVCVNSMILSILYQRAPAEVRLILIDPKIVELKLYNDIPHLLTPVITEPKRAFQALQYCIFEMERRYALLDSMGVRDIRSYNKRIRERNIATERLPYIVVVIDEFADLMATTGKELESTVARLAAMSRAVGIHLVLATQRPSIDVITGLIKANIPSRIAFMVAGKMDSRIIIDMVGAEKLLGKGDMLYSGVTEPFPVRMQGAFVSEEEVERVVEYVKTLGEPDYLDDEIFYDEEEEDAEPSLFADEDDPLYDKALEIVYQQGKASASFIQRRLKIGYNRAARLVELMHERGIVGPAQGSKPRDIIRGA